MPALQAFGFDNYRMSEQDIEETEVFESFEFRLLSGGTPGKLK